MRSLIALQDRLLASLGNGDNALPFAARFAFAASLALYFFNSGLTKLGDGILGIFQPSLGAYAQIFPRAMEAASYDTSQLGVFHWAVVTGGTVAEFVLPALIIIGLFARLASIGMIGFIVVQSLTDLIGHGAGDADVLLNYEDIDIALLPQPDQHLFDLLDDDRSKTFSRLIHHQKARVEEKGARNRQHLLLTA